MFFFVSRAARSVVVVSWIVWRTSSLHPFMNLFQLVSKFGCSSRLDKVDKDLEILKCYFDRVQKISAFVYVFRNDVEPPQSFEIVNGNSTALISFLRSVRFLFQLAHQLNSSLLPHQQHQLHQSLAHHDSLAIFRYPTMVVHNPYSTYPWLASTASTWLSLTALCRLLQPTKKLQVMRAHRFSL